MNADCFFFGSKTLAPENVLIGPPDAENQVYNAGDAPFNLGDERWRAGHVFRSLIDNNSADTSDGASWEDLGETDFGALAYAAGTYAEGVYAVLDGRIIRSTANNNVTVPGSAGATWLDISPTNRFKALELNSIKSAVGVGELKWVFEIPFTINSMLLMIPVGGVAYITVTDVNGNPLEDPREYRLTQDSGGGPYNHDFAPREPVGRVIVHGLPPGVGNIVTVRIVGGDAQSVSLAQIAMGFAYDVGVTVVGSSVRAVSLKDPPEDENGNITFLDRPTRRICRFILKSQSQRNDAVLSRVAPYLNQPAGMYLVDGVAFGLTAFGLVREVEFVVNDSNLADGVIEVKGFAEE